MSGSSQSIAALPMVGEEFRRAGVGRRILHFVVAYVLYFVVTLCAIVAFSGVMLLASLIAKDKGLNPLGDATLPWVDRAVAIGSWFVGMIVAIAAHRGLSRSYALVGRPTRCGSCGGVLRGLHEPACPSCGVRL